MTQSNNLNNADTDKFPQRRKLSLRLELTLDYFNQLKHHFLDDLANVLDIPVEEIWISDVRKGCVIVILSLPDDAIETLKKLWNRDSRSPKMNQFISDYVLEMIRFDDLITRSFFIRLANSKEQKPYLTWLHLSDIHLRGNEVSAQKFGQEKVTQQFLDELPKLLSERNIEPDIVFFTGDVSYSGEKEQYEVANVFFESLIAKLPNDPKFYFVPGNHDITWERIDINKEEEIRARLNSNYAVNQHLLEDRYEEARQLEAERLSNFYDFLDSKEHFGQPSRNGLYYYSDILKLQGLNIGISGLNSAWRSTRKDLVAQDHDLDTQNLILGEPQIRKTLSQLQDADLRIALLHHPPTSLWFKDFDIHMQENNLPSFDFILRGHEHRTRFFAVNPIGRDKPFFEMASGALYFHEEYSNGFNAVKINLETGLGTIYLWTYMSEYEAWRKNLGPSGAENNGSIEFLLPEEIRNRLN